MTEDADEGGGQTPPFVFPTWPENWHPLALFLIPAPGVDQEAIAASLNHFSSHGITALSATQLVNELEEGSDLKTRINEALAAFPDANVSKGKGKGKGKGAEPGPVTVPGHLLPAEIVAELIAAPTVDQAQGDLRAATDRIAKALADAEDELRQCHTLLSDATGQSATPALTEDNSAADVSIHAEGEDGTATQQARENVKKAESVVAAAREAAARPAQATRTFLLIGFGAGPERLSELAAAGVPVNGAVRLRVGDADESDPADPSTPAGMWEGLVQKQTEDADLILLDVPAGSQCPAVFTKSAPRGKPPTEEGVDPPAGWKELAGALITTSNAAAEYRAWKERATVYDVPDAAPAEEVDMELYRSLVSTVPEDQASVGVVMHCMLEQVARSCQEEREEANYADAVSFAASALSDALNSTRGIKTAADPDPYALGAVISPAVPASAPILMERDSTALAVHGARGGVAPAEDASSTRAVSPSPGGGHSRPAAAVVDLTVSGDGRVMVGIESTSNSGWRSFLNPDGSVAVERVERHMASLLPIPGCHGLGRPGPSDVGQRALRESQSVLAATTSELGVSPSLVELCQVLESALKGAPEGTLVAHEEEVLSRKHLDVLPAPVLAQVAAEAMRKLPDVLSSYVPSADCVVLSCFAASTTRSFEAQIPVLLRFRSYLDQLIAADGTAPDVPSVVYVVPDSAAHVAEEEQLHFPDDGAGSIVRTGTRGISLSVGDVSVSLPKGPGDRVLATLPNGTVITMASERGDALPGEPPVYNSFLRVTAADGLVTEMSQDGAVTFWRVGGTRPGEGPRLLPVDVHGGGIPGGAVDELLKAEEERLRKVLASGAVARHMAGGAVEVLMPDGGMLRRDGPAGRWVGTNRAGARWVVPDSGGGDEAGAGAEGEAGKEAAGGEEKEGEGKGEKADGEGDEGQGAKDAKPVTPPGWVAPPEVLEPVACATVRDPDSGAEVTTRADRVTVVKYATEHRMVTHADGTRIVTTTGLASKPAVEDSKGGSQGPRIRMSLEAEATGHDDEDAFGAPPVDPWVSEAPGLPRVSGSPTGCRTEPMPGLLLSWDPETRVVRAEVDSVGTILVADHLAVLCRGQAPVEELADKCMDLQEAYLGTIDEARAAFMVEEEERRVKHEEERAAAEAALAEMESKKKKKGGDEEEAIKVPPPFEPREFELPPREDTARAVSSSLLRCWVWDLDCGTCAIHTDESTGMHLLPAEGTVIEFPEPMPEEEEGEEEGGAGGKGEGGSAEDGDEEDADGGAGEGNMSDAESEAQTLAPTREASEVQVSASGDRGEGIKEGEVAMLLEEAKVEPVAPSIKPRVFIIAADGSGWEALSTADFEAILAAKNALADIGCCNIVVQSNPEPGTAAFGLTSCWTVHYDFLSQLRLRGRGLPDLPAAACASIEKVPRPRALPTLTPPSTVRPADGAQHGAHPESALRGLFLPRVLLPRVTVRAPQPAPVLVHREVIELEGLTESVRALCSEALRRVAEWLDGKAGRDPMAEYVQEDERGPSGEQEDAAVVEEALKAKAEMEGAEEEPHADGGEMEEEEAEEEESGLFREGGTGRDAGEMGEEESESFLASGVQENDVPSDVQPAARASSVASHASKPRAPRGQPRPEPGSVLRYFDSEEGLVALSKGMIVERPVGQGRTHYPGQDSVTVEDLEAIRKERRQARKSAATGVSVGGRSRGRAGYAASEKGAPSVHGSIASGIAAHVVRSRQGSIQRESTRAPADELTAEGAESEAFPVGFGEPLPRERPWEKSVTGGERRLVPELPDYMTRAVAEPVVNMRHLSVESEAFKMSRTAAGMNLQARGRFTKEFEVSPDAVDLGVLEIGQRATATLRITNIAAELARFHVERLAEPWHVVYRPGPLAVGMTTAVTVVFIASEPGVFTTSVNIRTESVVFRVPATVTVHEHDGPDKSADSI